MKNTIDEILTEFGEAKSAPEDRGFGNVRVWFGDMEVTHLFSPPALDSLGEQMDNLGNARRTDGDLPGVQR